MLLEIVICTLCAGGVLLLVWLLIGAFLLPIQDRELWIVLPAKQDAARLEQQVHACRYLQQTGFLHAELVVADCGMSPEGRARADALQQVTQLTICPAEALGEILKEEH